MELLSLGLQYPAGEWQNRTCPPLSRAGIPLVHTKEVPGDFCPCHPHDIFHHCGGVPTPFLAHARGTQVPWQLLLWLNQGELTFQFPIAWKRPLEKNSPAPPHTSPPPSPPPPPALCVHSSCALAGLMLPGVIGSQDSMWQLAHETLRVCLFWGQAPVLQDRRGWSLNWGKRSTLEIGSVSEAKQENDKCL